MTLNEPVSSTEGVVALPDIDLSRQISQLDHLFRRAGDSQEMRTIYQLVLDYYKQSQTS